jgi:hypothetical protein
MERLEITDRSAWFPFALLTVAHFYCTLRLIRALRRAHAILDDNSKHIIFETVSATGGIFVRGIFPRLPNQQSGTASIDPSDLSGAAATIDLPILLLAIVPFSINFLTLIYIAVALLVANSNWIIGSHWAIALSDFGVGSNRYFSSRSNDWTRVYRAGSYFSSGISKPATFRGSSIGSWLLFITFSAFTLPARWLFMLLMLILQIYNARMDRRHRLNDPQK